MRWHACPTCSISGGRVWYGRMGRSNCTHTDAQSGWGSENPVGGSGIGSQERLREGPEGPNAGTECTCKGGIGTSINDFIIGVPSVCACGRV